MAQKTLQSMNAALIPNHHTFVFYDKIADDYHYHFHFHFFLSSFILVNFTFLYDSFNFNFISLCSLAHFNQV
jgi:hypothetical protein